MLKNLTLAAALLIAAFGAQAHVTLEEGDAIAGTYYKAALQVGHGCDGTPVHTVVVRLPAGFKGAKPTPKAGWKIDITRSALAQPYVSHGKTIADDVSEIRWTAQSPEARLQDAWYDSFVLRGQLPDQPGPLWFKVLQVCDQGQIDWAEVPASGTSTKGLKAPAALLNVHPADPHAAHAH
ncbi:YcnI family copper-binding membrane protein [Leptothrix discophora]|uniref:YcnI family protein n=1 Tax=Leptothrix discophora TaxID=89 RepID=A0ABT9FZH6_LEPDI|nr:YcnI family protein [Leptothrix discophora]MDP4299618.1 YcnI family protein [Leptothrix discophora]